MRKRDGGFFSSSFAAGTERGHWLDAHAVLVGAIQHSGKIFGTRLVGRRRYQLAREVNDEVFNAPFAALGARLVKLLYVLPALLLVPQPVGVRGGKMTGGNGQPYLYGIVEKIKNGMFLEIQGKCITAENIKTLVDNHFYEYFAENRESFEHYLYWQQNFTRCHQITH